MGQAKRRGTFQERQAEAFAHQVNRSQANGDLVMELLKAKAFNPWPLSVPGSPRVMHLIVAGAAGQVLR